MSRYYELIVRTKNTTKEELKKVIIDELGWRETYLDDTEFNGSGNLFGGVSEKEAHEEISEAIKELNPIAKVKTRWTYMESLPYEEYGDSVE